jgi:hypothetical protein
MVIRLQTDKNLLVFGGHPGYMLQFIFRGSEFKPWFLEFGFWILGLLFGEEAIFIPKNRISCILWQ